MLKLSQLSLDYVDHHLTGRQFEFYVADLLTTGNDYKAKVTPATNDHGVDVIYSSKHGLCVGAQVKLTHGDSIGYSAEEEVIAGIRYYNLDYGIVITNGFFSSKAQRTAKKLHVRLWDRNFIEHYIKVQAKNILNNLSLQGVTSIKLSRDSVFSIDLLTRIMGLKNRQSLINQMINEYKQKHFNNPNKMDDFYKIKRLTIKQMKIEKRLQK